MKVYIKSNKGDFAKYGAEGQDRTGDTAIFSRVLYQLSYLAGAGKASGALPLAPARDGPLPRR